MSPIHIAHARATGKRKAGSFQVQRSHVPSKLSRVVSSLSTTNHPCAWTVPTSAERLSVWKSPQETTTLCVFYSESYAHIAIQRPCCPPVNSLFNVLCTIYCHKTRQGMWLLSHNQWGRSRSPKMRGIALVIGRAGASPPSRATGLNFLYIYICISVRHPHCACARYGQT